MKCPLLTIGLVNPAGIREGSWNDCLQEECAWWDIAREMCRLASFQMEIALLTKVLLDIRDKMPHEEQFRK